MWANIQPTKDGIPAGHNWSPSQPQQREQGLAGHGDWVRLSLTPEQAVMGQPGGSTDCCCLQALDLSGCCVCSSHLVEQGNESRFACKLLQVQIVAGATVVEPSVLQTAWHMMPAGFCYVCFPPTMVNKTSFPCQMKPQECHSIPSPVLPVWSWDPPPQRA